MQKTKKKKIIIIINKAAAFKNNAPFINCISKINGDVAMPMYNLIEYSENYKENNRKFVELL